MLIHQNKNYSVSLKSDVDKLHIDKLKTVSTDLNNVDLDTPKTIPSDLKKLSDVVDNDGVKKAI